MKLPRWKLRQIKYRYRTSGANVIPHPWDLFWVRLFSVLFFALGCAPSFERNPVWLPAGHPLAAAQAVWGLPLPVLPKLDESQTAAELVAVCYAGRPEAEWPSTVDACSDSAGRVWIASDLSAERTEQAKRHELGHVLAGPERDGMHLGGEGCEGPTAATHLHVMCPRGSASGWPTVRDFDFVLHLDG